MKKLLAILGSVALIGSTATTVVACGGTNNRPDYSKFNNSLPNMQGAASSVAKQLILTDQFKIAQQSLKKGVGKLKASDVVKQNTAGDYDSKDFNLNENSDLTSLTDQYFGEDYKTSEIKLSGDVNLDGTLGSGDGQLWKILEDKLGLNLGDTKRLIDGIMVGYLPNLTGDRLQVLLIQLFPQLDGTLGKLGEQNKLLLELISGAIEGLLGNPDILDFLTKSVDEFDIGTIYSDMKVESITSAALIALSNAIGPLLGTDYKIEALTKTDAADPDVVQKKLLSVGENLGQVIANLIAGGTQQNNFIATFENGLVENIQKYVGVIGNLLVFLQLLQLQFSLFDDSKDYLPTIDGHDNYLFSPNETNKAYIKRILGNGQTLREVTKTPAEQNIQGSLNLKYLFSIFKSAFASLENPDDVNGYSLEKFLAIIFIGPYDIDPDNFNDKMTSPMATYLGSILIQIIIQLLIKSMPDLEKSKDLIVLFLQKPITKFLSSLLELLLTGQSIQQPVINLLSDLINFLGLVVGFITDENAKKIIQSLIDVWPNIVDDLPSVLNTIPLLNNTKNAFKELYSGNPLEIEGLINILTDPSLQAIIKKDYPALSSLLDPVIKALQDFTVTRDNLLPDGLKLNLKNLLITPINKIGNQSLVPPAFGGYYLDKSIVEIINDIADKTYVSGKEKLSDFTGDLDGFNFKLSYIKDIFNMIKEYNYEYEGRTEKDKGRNLISILLENLDKTSTILGYKKDETFGEGSLLDLIFNKILKVKKDAEQKNDPFNFFARLISSLFNNLNSPNVDYSENYQKLFSDATNFNFEYQSPTEDEFGTLLGQTLVVHYHNSGDNTNWTYTFDYSREKVSQIFKMKTMTRTSA